MGQLNAPVGEKWSAADEEPVGPLVRKRREGGIDLRGGAGVENPDLQSHAARSLFHGAQIGRCNRPIGRIEEHGHTLGGWH